MTGVDGMKVSQYGETCIVHGNPEGAVYSIFYL